MGSKFGLSHYFGYSLLQQLVLQAMIKVQVCFSLFCPLLEIPPLLSGAHPLPAATAAMVANC